MPTIPYKEGADFPELPTKTPILCKVIESEFIEDDPNPWFGKETGKFDKTGAPIIDKKEFRNLVKVIFQAVEDEYLTSRIWFNATASINEKAKLRPLIEAAAFDHDPDKKELEAYDTDDLVGQFVYVTGSYGPKDTEHKFLRPDSFMRYAPQFKAGFNAKKAKAEVADDVKGEDDGADDEIAALNAKLAAVRAKKAQTAAPEESKADRLRRELAELEAAEGKPEPEAKPARKTSTRERAVAKLAEKTKDEGEAAF